ncbi:uncharacterized protein A4U43_C08F32630 [Asparagus officinalis]|nr:uncharacterized protein A4U43_C08F32630 [Asparagus officinalis]
MELNWFRFDFYYFRYEKLWMPLIADLIDSPLMILPPADVNWIWYCHCLHDPAGYREYCALRFGAVIDRPAIFDEENEEYAILCCREIWEARYPSEPFDLETDGRDEIGDGDGEISMAAVKYRGLVSYFADVFVSETVYQVSARVRYLDFLNLARKFGDESGRLVPASDVLLMWSTHKSFPLSYAKDLDEYGNLDEKIVGFADQVSEEELEETRRIWEDAFDEPYERSGALFNPMSSPSRVFFNWDASDANVNRVYKGLQPRFLLEVCIFFKGSLEERELKSGSKRLLRLRTARCHKLLKLDKPVCNLSSESWRKAWHLYCEFGTRGILIDIREHVSSCFRNSKLLDTVSFSWNDLLRSTSFTLTKEVRMNLRAMASITPPVQAPYLLKCVPDRVTDDSGAMISDVILRMNRYRPQEGRWLTRTVLDRGGKECFVVRIRVGRGIWRRGAENPLAVKWEDRIIEVREGPWSYVASSVGYAPEKVVGTATPKRESSGHQEKFVWCLSTGDALKIQWENGPDFQLENENSAETAKLLRGRQLQYQPKAEGSSKTTMEDENHYITLIRYSPARQEGKATALLNWKLLAVEFLPEEDAVFMLLLCTAIARTISEVTRDDVAGLLVRRRMREVKSGLRDWGSVMIPSPSTAPHLNPWYWNADDVLAPAEATDERGIASRYSPADGKDLLYKQCIMP